MSNEIIIRPSIVRHEGGQAHDALRDYLNEATVWERMPSFISGDLLRFGVAASLANIGLGALGWIVEGSQPPAAFFLIGASAITGFMHIVLATCPFVVGIGGLGLGGCGIASVRRSGLWLRVVIGGELLVAAIAVVSAAILLAMVVIQALVWLFLIVLVVSLCGAFVVIFIAGALDG